MSKKYSFRTTRETTWLEDILDSMPQRDRAKNIRELIIKGLESENVRQMSDKRVTNVVQMEDNCQTNVRHEEFLPIKEEEKPNTNKNLSAFT